MKIKFKKLHEKAVLPSYAKAGDAGLDMTATEIYSTEDFVGYKTGIAVEIPEGYVGLLFPRSSNCKKDLLLCNSVGVVDSGYRGEIEFRFKRVPKLGMDASGAFAPAGALEVYEPGERIGQLVIVPYPTIEPEFADELSSTERGEGGYGSSGK